MDFVYCISHSSLQRPIREYIDALQIQGKDIEDEGVYVMSLQQFLSQ